MKKIEITAFELAQRFIGIKEIGGKVANPQILAMLQLDNEWPQDDSVPWCGAFCNYVCWLLRLPRSKSLLARSWLTVGSSVIMEEAELGFTVVILKRDGNSEPGPEVIDAPGHVGFFAGLESVTEYVRPGAGMAAMPQTRKTILVLGGNQNDSVNVSRFPVERVLGVRVLYG